MSRTYLKTAASVVCLIPCALSIALWVRSYTWCDIFCLRVDNVHDQWLESLDGRLSYDGRVSLAQDQLFRWIVHPAERWRRGPFPTTNPFLGFCWTLGGIPRPVIPQWFSTFVLAGLAVLPWMGWRHFSLRSLLTAMTLAAIALGAIAYFVSMKPPVLRQTDVNEEDLFGSGTTVPMPQSDGEIEDLFGPADLP